VQFEGGTQGVVYLVEDAVTHEKYVLKSMNIKDSKKEDFEKMSWIWKLLCKSKVKDYVVEFKEHFYEGTCSSLTFYL
jgi:serine/threonine protein kinase